MNQSRINRFNSFEFSDSDGSQASLKSTIIELQQFFPNESIEFTRINELADESISILSNTDDDEEESFKSIPLYNLKFLKKIRRSMNCIEILKTIRSLLESRSADEIVNWDIIVNEKFNVNCYLTFIYTLMKLFDISQTDRVNRDLAFNAARTYICLLSIPGAKR
jgi:hypothetical protein